jgi:hypothetical protein
MTGPQKLASGEIWFKAQRAIRTVAQVIVTGAGILAVAVVVAPQILDALADVLPGPVVAWAAGVIAAAAALSAALSRVMAIPAVDAWLKRLGLVDRRRRRYRLAYPRAVTVNIRYGCRVELRMTPPLLGWPSRAPGRGGFVLRGGSGGKSRQPLR